LLGRVGYVDQKHPLIKWSRKKGPWADTGKGSTSTSHKTLGKGNISEVRPLSVWQASLSFQGMRSRAKEIAAAIQRREADAQPQERSSAARFSVGDRVVADSFIQDTPGFEAEITKINPTDDDGDVTAAAAVSYVNSSGEVPTLCMPLARSTMPPNTPLHFALQKVEDLYVYIKDLHRLSELDVRADARTRLVMKGFKFEDETEGGDDDDDKVLLRGLQPF
jgi:hypothetical protein